MENQIGEEMNMVQSGKRKSRPFTSYLRRKLRLLASAALVTAAAAQTSYAETPKDALVMAWNIDNISTLDPAQIGETVAFEIVQNTCDALVDYDPADESKVIPSLAERWDVSADKKEITFHLRKGMVFPSGNPATAQELAWSIRRALALNFGAAATLTEWGLSKDNAEERVVAPDDATLILKFDRPYSVNLILQSVAASRITSLLDRKLILENEQNGDLGNKYLAAHTACVGAYSLAQWNAGDNIILQANENYWGEKPALPRILIRHVPEPGTQRLLLTQGDVDAARDLTTDDLADLEKSSDVRILRTQRPQLFYWVFNTANPIFANKDVRMAMRYLVDYEGLGKTVMKQLGVPRASFLPLGQAGALDQKAGQPFSLDLDKAKALLAQAGYPNGFEANVITNTLSYVAPVAQSVQQNAAKIGVKLNIEVMTNPQVAGRTRARDFETAMMQWQSDYPNAYQNASRMVYNPDNRMEAKLTQFPSWRVSFQDEAMNAKVQEVLFETDPGKLEAIYRDLQEQMMEKGPYAVMFQTLFVAGVRSTLKNWTWHGYRNYYAKISK